MALLQEQNYTIEDIFNLPESVRAELIDGRIYYIAAPDSLHQEISTHICHSIANYIHSNKINSYVYSAPFAGFLDRKGENYFEPDIIVCDDNNLNHKDLPHTPDWVIEITSSINPSHSYLTKLYKYQATGVREYWIVSPERHLITVCFFNKINFFPRSYTFEEKVTAKIYPDLSIDFSQFDI